MIKQWEGGKEVYLDKEKDGKINWVVILLSLSTNIMQNVRQMD